MKLSYVNDRSPYIQFAFNWANLWFFFAIANRFLKRGWQIGLYKKGKFFMGRVHKEPSK